MLKFETDANNATILTNSYAAPKQYNPCGIVSYGVPKIVTQCGTVPVSIGKFSINYW